MAKKLCSMTEFRNLTPFPAQAFEGIDQRSKPFHVVVLRQTFALTEDGPVYVEEQAPLRAEDAYLGDVGRSSVLEESDFCQFKPRCDVIVNGRAFAPRGIAAERFAVRLRMYQRGGPVPLPPRPQGLNPFMPARPEAMRLWRETCTRLKGRELPGKVLINKTLFIVGPRKFYRRTFTASIFFTMFSWISFGLIGRRLWYLTHPEPCFSAPLISELAFGGECRITSSDPAAGRVPKRYRLDIEDTNAPLAACSVFASNPFGVGWTERWFLSATGIRSLPAPQIEHPDAPVNIDMFLQAIVSGLPENRQRPHAGFGVRPKVHPERSRLTGIVDEAFVAGERWLPRDFDFAVWNAAPPDQQIEFPGGGEVVELTNLCPADARGVIVDAAGNSVLRFELPRDVPFVLARFENGAIGELPARLDTLLIDTERLQLSCVWRATLSTHPAVRVLEARMIDGSAIAALKSRHSGASEPTAGAMHG